ncbi:MAG: AMP-binding protein [Rhodospirillaceae bacterium]|nr:AMP-binding protein [Rhodospirillaceae bacterium]MBL6930947.1 AMP-binding protein [Rhodospirillales bacterium]MBL6942329.1 AMP-binding protein [Rhodospirillales bacterium]
MSAYYDDLETRSGDQRESAQMTALADQVDFARKNAPYFSALFSDVDATAINTPEALASLPVTRKSDLIEGQKKDRPFGGLAAMASGGLARIFQSPGPIYEPEGQTDDFFRIARALYAAGFRKGDLVHNTFAYHLTPGGFMMDSGARALGCAVIPAGIGNTEQQLDVIADLKPAAYTGTPSFLKILLEKAEQAGKDASSFKRAMVSGEYFPPPLRDQWAEHGLLAYQCYATADLGLIAYESDAAEGMIVDEGVIVEIVRPGTGDPLPEGEVGEVVVTLFSKEYPLVRFATGDLSAVMAGASPCGRTNMRLRGWMGRADQTTKIKGMFVHPEQVAQVVARHKEIKRARLVVETLDDKDAMTLVCEVVEHGEALEAAIAETLQNICKLRGSVSFTDTGSLPNDGLVIEDKRSYD